MYLFRDTRHIKINIKNTLSYVLIPGIIIYYFISTEKAFIEAFQAQFDIMGLGEMLFMLFHAGLVYFIAPLLWILNFFLFFRFVFARSITYRVQVELASMIANFSYGILFIMTISRIFFE